MNINYGEKLQALVKNNIAVMGEKQTIRALSLYENRGNPNGFTDRYCTRAELLSIPKDKVKEITNGNVRQYVLQLVPQKRPENKVNINNDLTSDEIGQIVVHALKVSMNKLKNEHPELTDEQLLILVNTYIERISKNNYQSITKDNNLRKKVSFALAGKNQFEFNHIMAEYLFNKGIDVLYINEIKDNLANIILNEEKDINNSIKFN